MNSVYFKVWYLLWYIN